MVKTNKQKIPLAVQSSKLHRNSLMQLQNNFEFHNINLTVEHLTYKKAIKIFSPSAETQSGGTKGNSKSTKAFSGGQPFVVPF